MEMGSFLEACPIVIRGIVNFMAPTKIILFRVSMESVDSWVFFASHLHGCSLPLICLLTFTWVLQDM